MQVVDCGVIFDATQAPENCRSSAFTSVVQLADGTLIVAFRVGSGRDAPDGRLRIMRSRDVGESWETLHPGMTVAVDGIEGNLYAGYFTEIAPNRLLGVFVWVDRSSPELSFVNPVTAGVLPMRNLMAESRDGGETWGPFRLIDLSPQQGCSCTGPIFSLPDGALALPYESWKEYDDPAPGHHIASLRLSIDGGETWPEMRVVAEDPQSRIFYWDQRIAVHPVTGNLVAMFWTHDREAGSDIENHIAWGSAVGKNWSLPVATGWRGQHCQPIAIGESGLVAVYVQRHDPPSVRAVISHDFGQTWGESISFYESAAGTEPGAVGTVEFEDFWQDMMAWRFGHPRGVLLPDGDLFVAFYAGDGVTTNMQWVRINLDEN